MIEELSDEQLLRYSRHILLDELGVEGQRALLNSHALIIGAGGLGSPVALYLASAGIGQITLVDHDQVDATNLQRQIAHAQDRVGWDKVSSAKLAMQALNPEVAVHTFVQKADAAFLDHWVGQVSVVLDCSDNFSTRHAINRACVKYRTPLVSGAAIRWDGQLCVYDSRLPSSPCYACVFDPDQAPEETRCATMGVMAPLVGVIGSMQALEAIKLIAGLPGVNAGQLLMFEGLSLNQQQIKLSRRHDCPVCAHRPKE